MKTRRQWTATLTQASILLYVATWQIRMPKNIFDSWMQTSNTYGKEESSLQPTYPIGYAILGAKTEYNIPTNLPSQMGVKGTVHEEVFTATCCSTVYICPSGFGLLSQLNYFLKCHYNTERAGTWPLRYCVRDYSYSFKNECAVA